MKYTAIGFDYGGVLAPTVDSKSFNQEVSKLLGLATEEYSEIYFSLNHKINLGEITDWRDFWSQLLEKVGQPDKLEPLMELNDTFETKMFEVDSKMITLVDNLRGAGFKTGLLSNTTLESARIMRSIGLDKHFDAFHISAETKLMKPDPKAFQYFVHTLAVPMQEMIFIDDSEKSLSTAENCGFTPILFQDYRQLIEQLSELGAQIRTT